MNATKIKIGVAVGLLFAAGSVAAVTAGMSNLTGLDIKPKGYQTNSLVVRNDSGTAQITVAKAGGVTWAGAQDFNSTGDFAGTLTCSKGSGTALDVSTGGELNIDGTLDCNGNADFAGNVVLSGTGKIVSAASLVAANAGLTVAGANSTIMHNSNFTTGIGTGTTTGAVTIGGGSNTVAVNSSVWDVSTAGAVTGLGDITSATGLSGGWDIACGAAAADTAGQSLDVTGQTGGAASTDQVGQNGGSITITAGNGSAKDGAGATDGDGGSITITAGTKGGTTGGTEVDGIITLDGKVVITDLADGAGANTACATTCGAKACLFGLDAATPAVVDCADASADSCICIGP